MSLVVAVAACYRVHVRRSQALMGHGGKTKGGKGKGGGSADGGPKGKGPGKWQGRGGAHGGHSLGGRIAAATPAQRTVAQEPWRTTPAKKAEALEHVSSTVSGPSDVRMVKNTMRWVKNTNLPDWEPGPWHGETPSGQWEYREYPCKCWAVDATSLLRSSDADHDVLEQFRPADWLRMPGKCKYFLRSRGCLLGADCDFCHRHPVPKHLTGGGVTHPEFGRKLTEEERKEREPPDEQRKRWTKLYQEMCRNVREDQDFCTNLGSPVKMGETWVLVVVWGIHRMRADAATTQNRLAYVLGIPPQNVGVWMGRDRQCRAPGHFPDQNLEGYQCQNAGMALRFEDLVAQVVHESCQVPDVVWVAEADCDLCTSVGDRDWYGTPWSHKVAWLTTQYPCTWMGYFTNEVPNTNAEGFFLGRTGPWRTAEAPLATREYNEWGRSWTKYVMPSYGGQLVAFRTSDIPEAMRKLTRRNIVGALDLVYFAPWWFSDKMAFLTESVAGQRADRASDATGSQSATVGPCVEPDMWKLWVKTFGHDKDMLRECQARWAQYLANKLPLWTGSSQNEPPGLEQTSFGWFYGRTAPPGDRGPRTVEAVQAQRPLPRRTWGCNNEPDWVALREEHERQHGGSADKRRRTTEVYSGRQRLWALVCGGGQHGPWPEAEQPGDVSMDAWATGDTAAEAAIGPSSGASAAATDGGSDWGSFSDAFTTALAAEAPSDEQGLQWWQDTAGRGGLRWTSTAATGEEAVSHATAKSKSAAVQPPPRRPTRATAAQLLECKGNATPRQLLAAFEEGWNTGPPAAAAPQGAASGSAMPQGQAEGAESARSSRTESARSSSTSSDSAMPTLIAAPKPPPVPPELLPRQPEPRQRRTSRASGRSRSRRKAERYWF